MTSMSFIRMR